MAEERLTLFPPGRFVGERSEGEGGQSPAVQKVWDTHLKRFVACKLFLNKEVFASLGDEDLVELGITKDEGEALAAVGSASTRYTPMREAQLMSVVDHPNVISAIDVGLLDPGTIALVMPYFGGGTLAGRSFDGPWEHSWTSPCRSVEAWLRSTTPSCCAATSSPPTSCSVDQADR